MKRLITLCLTLGLMVLAHPCPALDIENGWFVDNGKVIWGYAESQMIWQNTQYTGITCRYPDKTGPCRTEDLNQLTDAMVKYGYPGLDYCFGLWYDRRRDVHDVERRTDANAVPRFFEQPWLRSAKEAAWDGLPKYDLTQFNDWYFDRLKEFARLSDAKGIVFLHNYYMQHALLEKPTHYVDFPWRPENCLQSTGMPDQIPAANVFYDVSNVTRRQLHRAYIRKCLDDLSDYENVIHVISTEYTGPLSFMQFWMDEILAWEKEKGKQVKIGLSATKDVTDAILQDPVRGPRITTVYLSYWWYKADGQLFAPPGGQEENPRKIIGNKIVEEVLPQNLHRQIVEYRRLYPDKAIVQHQPTGNEDHWPVARRKLWAFLTGGGSMVISYLPYYVEQPDTYIAPGVAPVFLPTTQFINTHLSTALPRMKPHDNLILKGADKIWCLADEGNQYLVYAMAGGEIQLDLSGAPGAAFTAQWLAPATGALSPASAGAVHGGGTVSFTAPDTEDWVLWLRRN